MGIPLTLFSLYTLQNDDRGCQHHLLLRVEQPAFSNADQGAYDDAVEVADRKRRVLIEAYETELLAATCPGPHTVRLVGELQAYPAGDVFFEEHGGFGIDLWIAETRYEHPWVVMGAAEDEAAFWRTVEEDEDLKGLGPIRPARKLRAFFLTEQKA